MVVVRRDVRSRGAAGVVRPVFSPAYAPTHVGARFRDREGSLPPASATDRPFRPPRRQRDEPAEMVFVAADVPCAASASAPNAKARCQANRSVRGHVHARSVRVAKSPDVVVRARGCVSSLGVATTAACGGGCRYAPRPGVPAVKPGAGRHRHDEILRRRQRRSAWGVVVADAIDQRAASHRARTSVSRARGRGRCAG